MDMRVEERLRALSDKEKQTLRLIVRGHDAKSTARSLGLSVHTINERLRDARRKLAVSSSREAARLLLDAEHDRAAPVPDLPGYTQIGEDAGGVRADPEVAPVDGVGRARRRPRIIIGVLVMTFALALLALATVPNSAPAPAPATEAPNAAVVESARQFLLLVDQRRWDDSYRATGSAFRKLNTPQVWADVSEEVRTRFGAVISRTFLSQENLPAPPNGYEVVKFRARYANQADAVETVTLDREDGTWRVVGVTIG